MPFELRLTPADGSFCSNSPTDDVPDLAMSSEVSVSTGPTESASLLLIREPVTMMSSATASVLAAGASSVCAESIVGHANAARLIPAAIIIFEGRRVFAERSDFMIEYSPFTVTIRQ